MRHVATTLVVGLCAALLVCLGISLSGCSSAVNDFWQQHKSNEMYAASQSVPTVEVNLGVIASYGDGNQSVAIARAIQRLSAEIAKHKNPINVTITWAPDKNPDHMEAVVSYYAPSQMLEYSPEVLGTTYRYEDVTPNLLRGLAKRHANDFHELTKSGCTETVYDND